MKFVLDGVEHTLDRETVVSRLRGRPPEPITLHWVEVQGVRFPVKHALEVALQVPRAAFTSSRARSIFDRLHFTTSTEPDTSIAPTKIAKTVRIPTVTPTVAAQAFGTLVAFLRERSFTGHIAELESALVDADGPAAIKVVADAGITAGLMEAALIVRRDVGRVSDVIHAAAITLALPLILESGERVVGRPSLGPGNDPSRQFDLTTDRRVAEFKVAVWNGGDVMRKRGLTADFVHLAMDESGRRPELWVAGPEPRHFLATSASSVQGLLSRSSAAFKSSLRRAVRGR